MGPLDKYARIWGENWVTGRYLLPLLRQIGENFTGVVLDLASGESPFRAYFKSAKSYIRVDHRAYDSEIVLGDLTKVPLPESSIDMVLLLQAVTDTASPVEVLEEVGRVLVPQGRLIVFETMCYPEHDLPYDFFRIMPEGLRTLADRANLKMVECVYLGGLFTRVAMLWNTFLMGQLKKYALTLPFAHLGIVIGNLIFIALDRLFPHPSLASDYIAILAPFNDAEGECNPLE